MPIYKSVVDGRSYEIETHPENYRLPVYRYMQTYRLRKDGSRGLMLSERHAASERAWQNVKAEAAIIEKDTRAK